MEITNDDDVKILSDDDVKISIETIENTTKLKNGYEIEAEDLYKQYLELYYKIPDLKKKLNNLCCKITEYLKFIDLNIKFDVMGQSLVSLKKSHTKIKNKAGYADDDIDAEGILYDSMADTYSASINALTRKHKQAKIELDSMEKLIIGKIKSSSNYKKLLTIYKDIEINSDKRKSILKKKDEAAGVIRLHNNLISKNEFNKKEIIRKKELREIQEEEEKREKRLMEEYLAKNKEFEIGEIVSIRKASENNREYDRKPITDIIIRGYRTGTGMIYDIFYIVPEHGKMLSKKGTQRLINVGLSSTDYIEKI